MSLSLQNVIQTVESLKIFGIIMALDGRIAFANTYTHQLLGYHENELNGKDFFTTLVPSHDQEVRRASFSRAIDSGGLFEERERDYVTKNGQIKWVEVKSTIVSEIDGEKYLSVIGEDISERKKVTEALNRSNAQLQDLIDNTTDLIQIIGASGRFLFVNKAWCETMGYTQEESRELKFQDILHPEFAHLSNAQFEKVTKGEVLEEYTGVVRRKDGRRLYLSGSISCRFEKGVPTAFRCILHDATAKIRAERASKLFASIAQVTVNSFNLDDLYFNIHKQLGEVIDVKNFFIAQYDPGKSYLYFPYYIDEYFNSRVHFTKRKLGNGLTEYAIMANKPLILHDDDIHQLAKEKKIYLYGVVPKVMLCVPLRIGDRVTGIIGVKSYERTNKYEKRDLELLDFISGQVALAIARKQSEAALARETARLNAIFEGSAHLMWSVNKRLFLTSFNHDYADLLRNRLQIEPQVSFSTEKLGFKLVDAARRRELEEKYKQAFRGTKQHFEIQLSATAEEEETWLEVYLNPIFLENGNIEEVSGIARDISDLKRNQKELVEAREQAEHSLKVKEQFLANMSHEIRTPMNGVIGMIDLLSETNLQEEQRDYVQTIKKSSETLLHILNDILDLAKIEAGKMLLQPNDVLLEDIFDRLMALFSQVAQQKNNHLRYELDEQLPKVLLADETRLLQILSNFTSNALKFTENGEVTVKAKLVKQKGDTVTIRIDVSDTGVGISKENIQKLFNSFQQLDNSTKKVYGGTGLGLAISKELTKMMKGEVGVISEEGKGSTFWFTVKLKLGNLDLVKDKKVLVASSEISNRLVAIQPIILLVDDNSTNRKVASEILKKAGCIVETATSGKEAIARLSQAHSFDLVLMDIQMPGMDGMETTQHLKSLSLKNLPPIVAMTAYAMKEDKERFLAAGMDDYLAKPIRAGQLIEMVECKVTRDERGETRDERGETREERRETRDERGEMRDERGETRDERGEMRNERRERRDVGVIEVIDFDILQSLQDAVGGEVSFVLGMLEEFIEEARTQISSAETAYLKDYCKGVQSELHTLKGNSGTLGASEVHRICEIIEAKAKVCDFKQFEHEIIELKNALDDFEKAVQLKFGSK